MRQNVSIYDAARVGKSKFQGQTALARRLLKACSMSSLDNIYQKMVPAFEPSNLAQLHHESPPPELQQQIGRDVAHDLNNILTIIQGYADRLVLKHGDNPTLRPDLQLISDNARRAVSVVRQASARRAATTTATA
jgi:signal transduction histidine kinase